MVGEGRREVGAVHGCLDVEIGNTRLSVIEGDIHSLYRLHGTDVVLNPLSLALLTPACGEVVVLGVGGGVPALCADGGDGYSALWGSEGYCAQEGLGLSFRHLTAFQGVYAFCLEGVEPVVER